MNRRMAIAGGPGGAGRTGADIRTGRAAALLRRVLLAPFSRRARTEFWYLLVSLPLAATGFAFTMATVVPPLLAAVSAPGVRKLGAASRVRARKMLGEDVLPPPGDHRAIGESHRHAGWLTGTARDRTAWRARGYLVLKLPLAVAGLAVAAGSWLGGLFFLTFPAWWAVLLQVAPPVPAMVVDACSSGEVCTPPHGTVSGLVAPSYHFLVSIDGIGSVNLARYPLMVVSLGAALLLAAPWLTRAVTDADRSLIRRLLGPATPDERLRALRETRARAVDDSALRLRGIERDLHDGTQAQLVALAMKLGLAKEKLAAAAPADMARASQLVDDAHRGAIEAIADLRVLARGIHPPVLDNGLADALASLAARSAMPVELVTDIPQRPSAAIETIAYFSAAELLTNAARHSGARHVTLEAVHVSGLLRLRISDDGAGGARLVPRGGLCGLADRARTVDGRLDITSPPGGPTVVTVELPSHA